MGYVRVHYSIYERSLPKVILWSYCRNIRVAFKDHLKIVRFMVLEAKTEAFGVIVRSFSHGVIII
jgi:hypothetical protein